MQISNIKSLTNSELLQEINQLLTPEEQRTIANMTTGLQIKLVELDKIKDAIARTNPKRSIEVLENQLADALARTKESYGSSLALNPQTKKLAVIDEFLSTADVDSDNFQYMSSFSPADRNLELMIIKSTLDKILDMSTKGMFEHLDGAVIVEIKRRLSGIKSIEESDNDLLKVS